MTRRQPALPQRARVFHITIRQIVVDGVALGTNTPGRLRHELSSALQPAQHIVSPREPTLATQIAGAVMGTVTALASPANGGGAHAGI